MYTWKRKDIAERINTTSTLTQARFSFWPFTPGPLALGTESQDAVVKIYPNEMGH